MDSFVVALLLYWVGDPCGQCGRDGQCEEAPGCQRVLPYRHVTHSGQLEVAREIGLALLAPDVLTLRDQFAVGVQAVDAELYAIDF